MLRAKGIEIERERRRHEGHKRQTAKGIKFAESSNGEYLLGSMSASSPRRAIGSIDVAARVGRRFPPAGIRNVVAINTMNTCDHRVLVEATAIVLGDFDCRSLCFRRPRNNAADIVPIRAINADAGREYHAKRSRQHCLPSHSSPSPGPVPVPPIRFMLKA